MRTTVGRIRAIIDEASVPPLNEERLLRAKQMRVDMENMLNFLRQLASAFGQLTALENQATIMRYLAKVQGPGDNYKGWIVAEQQAQRAFQAIQPIKEQVTYAASALSAALQRMPSLDD